MKFLELCRSQGALQPTGTSYRFHEVTPWMQPTGSEAESPIAADAGSLAPGMAPSEGTGAFGWRIARSYLASRRMLGCALVLAACALSMRVALHWIPPSGLASRELPLVFVAGAAAVIGFGVGVPFSGQGHAIGRQLPGLQLAAVVGMVCAAVALFAAGAASAHLADGTLGMVRNLAGLTGVALLSAAAFGGPLAWVMPMAYSLVTLYALEHAWTTPWIWPARAPRDVGAALCAALIFAAGIAVISARGARSDPSPEPGHV
jgi:hypothetical protein